MIPQNPTTQELFTHVKNHLLKQGQRCIAKSHCLYRGPNGMQCAVGSLIDNKHYSGKLESEGVDNCFVRASVEGSIGRPLATDEINMLGELQTIHDCTQPENWPDALARVAKASGLTY